MARRVTAVSFVVEVASNLLAFFPTGWGIVSRSSCNKTASLLCRVFAPLSAYPGHRDHSNRHIVIAQFCLITMPRNG